MQNYPFTNLDMCLKNFPVFDSILPIKIRFEKTDLDGRNGPCKVKVPKVEKTFSTT